MQLYCSLPPKNVIWNFLISVVEAVTAIVILIMQHKKTQGAYLLIQQSGPSYCSSEGREGRPRRSLWVRNWGARPRVLCPVAQLLRTMCFSFDFPAFDFLRLCSVWHLLEPALPSLFRNPRCSGLSRTPHSGLWRPLTGAISMRTRASRSLWALGLGLFGFVVFLFFISSFSRRDVQCFTRIPIWHHSFKHCNAIQITLRWEKMQSCVSLLSVNP